ncbi:LysR family transcriptional regulator [Amycolatopsis palatopharyngis]|uniref:LysR family transcriptional regulator n=1 Tax=Amycolatopsis palatopharyngis TaxID=187982 RepID=UPI00319D9BAE
MHKAANALHVAQPSLSQTIRVLERDLGTALFHRFGRRLVLTQAGHALIEPARQIVRGLAAMPSQAIEPLGATVPARTAALNRGPAHQSLARPRGPPRRPSQPLAQGHGSRRLRFRQLIAVARGSMIGSR